jgi:hypothetical protein
MSMQGASFENNEGSFRDLSGFTETCSRLERGTNRKCIIGHAQAPVNLVTFNSDVGVDSGQIICEATST